jgi:predicted metallopeptidase
MPQKHLTSTDLAVKITIIYSYICVQIAWSALFEILTTLLDTIKLCPIYVIERMTILVVVPFCAEQTTTLHLLGD